MGTGRIKLTPTTGNPSKQTISPREQELQQLLSCIEELKPHEKFMYSLDDMGFGALFADCFKDTVRYNTDDGQWYVFQNGVWILDKGAVCAERKVTDLIRILRLYIDNNQQSIDSAVLKPYQAFLKRRGAQNSIKQTLNAARADLKIESADFDRDTHLLNCLNGVYDLQRKAFRASAPGDLCKLQADCNFSDKPTPKNHRWYRFIDEIMSGDKEKSHFLQKALGASLLGDVRDECMFIAYGVRTRNGKGTLFNTIKAVLGSYAGTVDSSLLCESKYKNADYNKPEPMLANTVGVRYLTLSETSIEAVLDSNMIKSLTGRDPRQTRKLNSNPFTFTPQFTMWLSTNFLPSVKDDSVFTSKRIWVIDFDAHFDGDNQDVDLKAKFLQPENRSVILRWMLDGYRMYVEEGLNPPQCVIDSTNHYAMQSNPVLCFIDDCLNIKDGEELERQAAYNAYVKWCSSSKPMRIPIGNTTFYRRMEQHFILKNSNGYRRFVGVALKGE